MKRGRKERIEATRAYVDAGALKVSASYASDLLDEVDDLRAALARAEQAIRLDQCVCVETHDSLHESHCEEFRAALSIIHEHLAAATTAQSPAAASEPIYTDQEISDILTGVLTVPRSTVERAERQQAARATVRRRGDD